MGVWFHKTIIWSGWSGLPGAPSFAESIGASRKVCLESCLQGASETEIDRGDRGNRRAASRLFAVRLHDGDRGGKANRGERVYRFCVAKRREKATGAGPHNRISGKSPLTSEFRHRADWLRVSRIQELARYPQASTVPVLQECERGDTEDEGCIPGSVPEVRSVGAEEGEPRRGVEDLERETVTEMKSTKSLELSMTLSD
jgi:hypothetical protein